MPMGENWFAKEAVGKITWGGEERGDPEGKSSAELRYLSL